MKIAHIVCAYPPYHGGMGNVTFQMVQELAMRGHDVRVYTPGIYSSEEIRSADAPEADHDSDTQQQIATVKRLAPALKYGNAAYLPSLKKELEDMDIVHLHYPFYGTANLVRRWRLKTKKGKLVITYHMDTRAPGWKGLMFQLYTKFWMPKIFDAADAIIGSSFDYVSSSSAGKHLSLHTDKWHEVPFGVDTDRFQPREKARELFESHDLDPSLPTIVFVGGMDDAHYFKGIPVLLKALDILYRQDIPVQALMVGDGSLREKFTLQSQGMGLKDLVRFVGRISDEELPYYYNAGDVSILPSIHQGEAFGMVLLESMASGVPVIASDLPGVRTVAQDGGVVVPVHDPHALAQAMYDMLRYDKKDELSRDIRDIVMKKYAWGSIMDRVEGIYRGVVVE